MENLENTVKRLETTNKILIAAVLVLVIIIGLILIARRLSAQNNRAFYKR